MNIWQKIFPALRQQQDSGLWISQILKNISLSNLIHNAPHKCPVEPDILFTQSAKAPLPLDSNERKLVQAFGYILTHKKKSSKRQKLMQALHDKYPSEDLAEMLLTYTMSWEKADQAENYGKSLLRQHPDSLGLRLNLGLLALSQTRYDKLAPLLEATSDWQTFQQLHPKIRANPQNIRTYHSLACLYATTLEDLRQAIYTWAVCREAKASPAELQTLSREIGRRIQEETKLLDLREWIQACN